MTIKGRKQFDRIFKLGAVALVLEQGRTQAQVAKDLGIGLSTLHKWLKDYRDSGSQDAFPGSGNLRPEDEEVRQLREENRLLRMERDLLKKTMGYFVERPK
jgi:transposase